MIIDIVSDLHGEEPELQGGDLLIVAGDCTSNDSLKAWVNFVKWLDVQDYKKTIIVAGNHDNWCRDWAVSGTFTDEELQLMYPGCTSYMDYLCDSGTEFGGLKIWGSPWTRKFPGINPHCCAFTVDTDAELRQKWNLIPEDTDILITHCPPYGLFDSVRTRQKNGLKRIHTGSGSLADYIHDHLKNLKLHAFGHIHEHGGQQVILKRPGIGTENNVICVNASIMNEEYMPTHKPTKVIL